MNPVVLGLIYTVITGLLWMTLGVIFSKVADKGEDVISFTTVSAFFSVLFSLFFINWGTVFNTPTPRMGTLTGIMLAVGTLNMLGAYVLIIAMKKGHKGITWVIGQSAMMIPFLASVVIWGNAVAGSGILGIILIVTMIGIMGAFQKNDNKQKYNHVWLLLSLSVFVMYGVQQTISTIPSRWYGWEDVNNLRVPLNMLGGFLCQEIMFVWGKKRVTKSSLLYGAVAAAFILLGSHFVFLSLDTLSDSALLPFVYPLAIGLSIGGMSVYSYVFLKEKLRPMQITGLLLGLAGIILISIS